MFPKISWIAWTRRHFNSLDPLILDCRGPKRAQPRCGDVQGSPDPLTAHVSTQQRTFTPLSLDIPKAGWRDKKRRQLGFASWLSGSSSDSGREGAEDAFQLSDVDMDPDLGQQEPLCRKAESMVSKRTWQTSQGERTWGLDLSSQHYLCVLFNKSSVTLQAALFFTGHDYNANSIIWLYSNNPISGDVNM